MRRIMFGMDGCGPFYPFDRSGRSLSGGSTARGTLRQGALATLLGLVALATLGGSGPAAAQEDPTDLARGEQLYALCAQCHGTAGAGNEGALAPAIANLPRWYVQTQLGKFKGGIRGLHPDDMGGLRMYPMSQWLRSDEDLLAVAAYVGSMPEAEPVNAVEASGDPGRGQGYYAVCSACHGAQALGNEAMGAPPLTGLNDWYLLSSLKKFKAGIRGSGPGDALGSAMIGMASTLPDEQAILDVIAYIRSLEN